MPTEIEELKSTITALIEDKTKHVAMLKDKLDEVCGDIKTLGDKNESMAKDLKDAQRQLLRGIQNRYADTPRGFVNDDTARFLGLAMLAYAKKSNRRAYDILVNEFGDHVKAHAEGDPGSGGILVPENQRRELIINQATYGLARQLATYWPMGSDKDWAYTLTGELTVVNVDEAGTIDESTLGFGRVGLIARKWGAYSLISSELNEDAVIDIGNIIAQQMVYSFAQAEDNVLINGDGAAATYFGVVGLRSKLTAINGVDDGGSLVLGSGNLYSELTLEDHVKCIAQLGEEFDDDTNLAWLVSRKYYFNVMVALALDAGGVNAAEIQSNVFARQRTFLGYPVKFSPKMPKTQANSQVCALFGNYKRSVVLGDRRTLRIETNDNVKWLNDQRAVRALQRIDMNYHAAGTATVAGGVIGLITAAS